MLINTSTPPGKLFSTAAAAACTLHYLLQKTLAALWLQRATVLSTNSSPFKTAPPSTTHSYAGLAIYKNTCR